MSCSTDKLIVTLSAEITTVNVNGGTMYCTLIKSLVGLVENILCGQCTVFLNYISIVIKKSEIDLFNKTIQSYISR